MTAKFEVGQTVIVSQMSNSGLLGTEKVVTKVGRKYVWVGNSQFDMATGRMLTPFGYADQIWTPDEWATEQKRREEIDRFRRHTRFIEYPYSMTYNQLQRLNELLDEIDPKEPR